VARSDRWAHAPHTTNGRCSVSLTEARHQDQSLEGNSFLYRRVYRLACETAVTLGIGANSARDREGDTVGTMLIFSVLVVLVAVAFQPRSILGGLFAGLITMLPLVGGLSRVGSLPSP